jgi:hypothetical protein
MEVITIQTEAFRKVMQELNEIKDVLAGNKNRQPLSDRWLDIGDVCCQLHISKRTLQSYRDNKILPYSQIGGKIYFKATDIEELLNSHYTKLNNSKNNR